LRQQNIFVDSTFSYDCKYYLKFEKKKKRGGAMVKSMVK